MNVARKVPRVPGVQDRLEEETARVYALREALQHHLASYGYRAIDTPVLESTELYLRKSGAEVGSQMYTFTDPGGNRASLRPEFTASVIRAYIEHADRLPLPLRWQYYGPVFRFGSGADRQFTQLGAEFIGSSHPRADAEIVALACQGARDAGLRQHTLVIGHRGVLQHILNKMGLSERAKTILLNGLSLLREGETGVEQLRKRLDAGEDSIAETTPTMGHLLLALDHDEAQTLVQHLLREVAEHPIGSRPLEQIVARFLAKLREAADPGQMERSLRLLAELCHVRAAPDLALTEGRAILSEYGLDAGPLAELEDILGLLPHHNLGQTELVLDFGLARGLAYYTGMIFEIQHPLLSSGQSLCGGGRYDGLVRTLGGATDVPALGFAFAIERLIAAQEREGAILGPSMGTSVPVLVVPQGEAAYPPALKLADSLRRAGQPTELEVEARAEADYLAYAQSRGIAKVVVVGEQGIVREHILKTRGGKERRVAAAPS